MVRRLVRSTVIGFLGLLLAIQIVPYGRHHTNPPVQTEPAWDSQPTREMAVRACYDCHSNQTVWPWYSHIAPVSWLVQRDVDEGRKKLNFSEWDLPQREARESAKAVRKGKMPQWYYVLGHPEALLSPAERQAFIEGLQATFGREKQDDKKTEEKHEKREQRNRKWRKSFY